MNSTNMLSSSFWIGYVGSNMIKVTSGITICRSSNIRYNSTTNSYDSIILRGGTHRG